MSAHLDRDQLVDWRDHGTGGDAVIGHLAACQSCAGTYAELVRTRPVTEAPARFDPADFVECGYAVRERAAGRQSVMGLVGRWLAMSVDIFWHPPVPLARAAVAALAALILVLATMVARPGFREQPFATLSGPPASAPGVRLTVMFQPNITEEAMRRALLEVEGTLVSGPSALGVYVVQLPERADDLAVQSRVDRLRADTAVVRFVEREP